MKRLLLLTAIGGLLTLSPGTAQEPRRPAPPATPTAKAERTLYAVRNGDPEVLAQALAELYAGEAKVIAAPAGSGNAVLVSGPAATVAEVVTMLEKLDRKPRTVEVEITIVEAPAAKDGKELNAAELLKDGKGQRLKLTAVEGREVTSTTGGNKPFVTGSQQGGAAGGGRAGAAGGAGGAGGFAPRAVRSVSYQAVGSTVKMMARAGTTDAISLDLSVQDTRGRASEDEGGEPSFDNASLSTKLSVPAGRPVVAQTLKTDGKSGATVSVVIVTARVVDDPRTAAK